MILVVSFREMVRLQMDVNVIEINKVGHDEVSGNCRPARYQPAILPVFCLEFKYLNM